MRIPLIRLIGRKSHSFGSCLLRYQSDEGFIELGKGNVTIIEELKDINEVLPEHLPGLLIKSHVKVVRTTCFICSQ